uniref:AsIV-cont00159-ORF1 n=1 Tax=Apophua simplicipes ichnovirus TaxID=1329648 RepID=S5DZ11_9VIRU|nr:AsIV-cont00159-ORF1 [Apophua simplicipes ichnovirus]
MAPVPTAIDLTLMNLLVEEIKTCSDYLNRYKDRQGLDSELKANLLSAQLKKTNLTMKLKMLARNFETVPQSVLDVYFPSSG